MLYVRSIDDSNVTHATGSTTQSTTLCGNPTGRTRLDLAESRTYDATSSTSVLERRPVPVERPSDVTCPACAAALAPARVKAQGSPRTRKPRTPKA